MMTIDDIMVKAPVIPVLVMDDITMAEPVARTLVKAGLPVIEVTLRTPAALDIIEAMSKVEGAIIGAGTVLNETDLKNSMEAGAQFIVAPGLTEPLSKAAIAQKIPYLPGISNPSDIMRGLALGLTRFKFFPAEALGGIPTLKAFSAPFHNCRFCPTGGITAASAKDWLALNAVLCVGGSWILPSGTVDLNELRKRAEQAAQLGN